MSAPESLWPLRGTPGTPGRSGGAPGRLLDSFRVFWGALGRQFGPRGRPDRFFSVFLSRFGIDLGAI